MQDETAWLTHKALAELFGVKVPAINKHLKNRFETGELERKPTIFILETVRHEGSRKVKRQLEYYNLDAIIAVGYRVNSYQATQFRIWGKVSAIESRLKAEQEFESYRQRQDAEYISDFDREIKRIEGKHE